MATMIRTTVVKVLGDRPVDVVAIEQARYRFIRDTTEQPTWLVLSPSDIRELQMASDMFKYVVKPDTVMGMLLKVDPDVKDGEWYVSKEDSKTYGIED